MNRCNGWMMLLGIPAVAILSLLAGCVSPEGDQPGGTGNFIDELESEERISGASSSTNWPTKDVADTTVAVQWRADSSLVLIFRLIRSDGVLQHAEVEGILSLYPGGAIPALRETPVVRLPFSATSNLVVPDHLIDSLLDPDPDTVRFSLAIQQDTLHALVTGFGYSRNEKRYFKEADSVKPRFSAKIAAVRHSFQGALDTSLLPPPLRSTPAAAIRFYIPGSPYAWKGELASNLEIGPAPYGSFPLRLLALSSISPSAHVVRIYPVLMDTTKQNGRIQFHMRVGEPLVEKSVEGEILLLP